MLQALYDIGGPDCFPKAKRKPDRPVPPEVSITSLSDEACDRLKHVEHAILDGRLLPLNPAPDQAAADVRRYLTAETVEDLNAAFLAHVLGPADALFRSLLALPEFERHLQRHLLNHTLVHLGENLKEDTKAWRAFNRLMLETLNDLLGEVAKS